MRTGPFRDGFLFPVTRESFHTWGQDFRMEELPRASWDSLTYLVQPQPCPFWKTVSQPCYRCEVPCQAVLFYLPRKTKNRICQPFCLQWDKPVDGHKGIQHPQTVMLERYSYLAVMVQVKCCFTSTETIRTIRDGQPRTANSTGFHTVLHEWDASLDVVSADIPPSPQHTHTHKHPSHGHIPQSTSSPQVDWEVAEWT